MSLTKLIEKDKDLRHKIRSAFSRPKLEKINLCWLSHVPKIIAWLVQHLTISFDSF